MAELGLLAYPALMLAVYGVVRVGREQRWGSFEWLRIGAVGLLLGVLVSAQVNLVLLVGVQDARAVAAALVGLIGMGSLAGLYIWERWQHQARLPRLTATLRL